MIKKLSYRGQAQRGFSLMMVIFVMLAMSVVGLAAVSLVSTSSQRTADEATSQRAFDVTQAGLAYIAKVLEGDGDWSDNAGVTRSFDPGSFTVTFLAQTFNAATVRSDGTVDGITRSVTQEMGRAIEAFNYGLYSEDAIEVKGGASGDTNGPARAGGDIDDGLGMTFHDTVEPNDSDVDVPSVDWSYWQGIANYTIAGNYTFGAGIYSGIYYITGNVTFADNAVINGTIVAGGAVAVNSASDVAISATAPNPAIVAGGVVSISGSTTVDITGFVVSMDDITLSGNTGLTNVGGYVAAGNITFTGISWADVTYDATYAPFRGFVGGEGGLTLSAWREIF